MPSRRTFLVAGLAGSAALFTAWWMRNGRERAPPSGALAPLATLDPDAPAIIAAIVPVMLDGALPFAPAERAAAIDETAANVARAVAGLPPAAQKELGQLFSLLALAPARIGLARIDSRWAAARPDQVAAFLDRWRTSHWKLQRAAYDALHQLVYAAWYGNPKSWPAIGYPGPPALAG
jgi:hypothetical protein